MKPLDIKSTRPSRERLAVALQEYDDCREIGQDWDVIVDELRALQQGMEELERRWRRNAAEHREDRHGSTARADTFEDLADELQKLREGT